MGKITECSTIMLSWSSAGINGPLEIDLVSATTGDIITVNSNIDLSGGAMSYKWTVAAPADIYYLEGNAADFSSLIYSGNFTVSDGTSTACLTDKQSSASGSASASGSGAAQSAASSTVKPSTTGSNFSSGSDRVVVSGVSIVSLAVLALFSF
jgi:hypothetical protein